jgi:hypothetical protein
MDNLAHRHFRDRVGNHFMSVIVYHGTNVRPVLIDRAMDGAFTIHGTSTLIDRIAIEIELHDVVQDDKFGAAGPRHKKSVRTLWMAHADMSETVNHPFSRQDAIGNHQVFKLFMQCLGHVSALSSFPTQGP